MTIITHHTNIDTRSPSERMKSLERGASSGASAIFGHEKTFQGAPAGVSVPLDKTQYNRTVEDRPARTPVWSAEQIEELILLVDEGHSAGQIANRIGRTRNSVISKVHRLQRDKLCKGFANQIGGWSTNTKTSRPVPPKRQSISIAGNRKKAVRGGVVNVHRLKKDVKPVEIATPDDIQPLRLRLEQLTAFTCRWPLGDPKEEGFGFCGIRIHRGSYCRHHAQIAYRPREVVE